MTAAGDPLWGDLRLGPCDVFAVELKKKVLEEPVAQAGLGVARRKPCLFICGGRSEG